MQIKTDKAATVTCSGEPFLKSGDRISIYLPRKTKLGRWLQHKGIIGKKLTYHTVSAVNNVIEGSTE